MLRLAVTLSSWKVVERTFATLVLSYAYKKLVFTSFEPMPMQAHIIMMQFVTLVEPAYVSPRRLRRMAQFSGESGSSGEEAVTSLRTSPPATYIHSFDVRSLFGCFIHPNCKLLARHQTALINGNSYLTNLHHPCGQENNSVHDDTYETETSRDTFEASN